MKYLLLAFLVLPLSIRGATLGVSYDSGTRNVLQTDLDYVGATGNFTTSLQLNGVSVVTTARSLTAGVGLTGGGDLSADRTFTLDLSELTDNQTIWSGASASRTITFNLSAGDPVLTLSSGVFNISSGTLQFAGNTVGTAANNLSFFAATTSAQFFGVLSDEVGTTGFAIRVAGTASNGFVPVSDGAGVITWSAQSGGGGGGTVGTVVNTGASTQYAIPYYLDATGTNIAPSLLTTDATFTNFYAGGFLINTLTVSNDVSLAGNVAIGGSLTVTNGPIQPSANNVVGLGTATLSFADLFLASTAVINFGNGNVTITHAAGAITVAGATTFSLGTSAAFTTGTIELGHATANTLAASAGDMTIEGNRIFRVGGADVPVADGGTGLSSGTSGGILYYSASGTLASSGALAANALVVGGGAGVTPATVTTGAGNLTALAIAANSAGGFVTDTGTATFTGKTYDAAATGNVLKQTAQLNLQRPDYGDGIGAVPQTNAFNVSGLMHYTFSGNAETNANYVVYEFDCPSDLDTTVEITARFAFLSGGTDADNYVFHLTYGQVAPGTAYPTGTGIATSPIVMTVTPTTAANGDFQTSGEVTLTGWAAALTPGRAMTLRIARLQNTQDDGARDVQLVITYGSTL